VSIIGIGMDAIEIDRVRTACTRTPGLLTRLYTEGERARCLRDAGEWRYEGLAARFAAKEAVAKALGTGVSGFRWVDVEVDNDGNGKPHVRLHGPAAAYAAALGVTHIHCSLTTARELSFAYVVLEGGS
jgi:holo-[acyl-carrier protein] synthase